MRALARVLLRAVAAEFYRHYAGCFIAGGLLLGSALSSNEHATLIREAIRDARLLASVYLLPWTLYTVVSARFAFRLWAQATYEPLRDLRLVPFARRWTVGLVTQAEILSPCWAYGTVIIGVAARAGLWRAALLTGGWLALLTVLGWLAHEAALRRGAGSSDAGLLMRLLTSLTGRGASGPTHRSWPPALWNLRSELHDRPLGLAVLKVLSVASIWGLCRVFSPDTFDARMLTLGALLTAVLHARLPADLYGGERARLAFRWNLPLGPAQRWREQALLTSVLLLPELAAWARWCPLPAPERWGWALRLTLFPAAALLLAGASLLRWPRQPADFLVRALAVAFGVYLALLSGAWLDGLTVAAGLGSWWLTQRYYWQADDPPAPANQPGS